LATGETTTGVEAEETEALRSYLVEADAGPTAIAAEKELGALY